ncbi:SpoIID/LytB domain-containing protein [Halocella sp. SP3-1]|uniref:SpoIID/LytB domain-containing protein n=1 Tax=Halocella sp. SP3-1 TaxID=2382161 RepID=UPI000F75F504|nr:SpoIID/LytB domain-containing protein [Halocella sp. SP3-1]AZO93181.1 SpoIID/LytB domain-containing protein [Halocella sp. SP3-1]
MKFTRLFLFIFIFIIIMTMAVACDNQARVKGVRERNRLEKEPEIVVKLTDGQEKQMKFEEYITGVVAGEMKKGWPANAYAAQAIIARTFALKYMDENKTNVISGSYEFAQEFKPENVTQELADAVSKTRGEVVVHQDDYIKGWFHASAGGQTTSAKVGLAYEKDEPPYIKIVNSPDEMAPEDVQNWTIEFSNREIEEALSSMGKDIGVLEKVIIEDRDRTGRIIDLSFKGSKGSATVKAANFRNELDPKRLKSTKISEIKKQDDRYSFSGAGFGHGVGMSQWGAYAMAKDGRSPEEIVSHYFKDIEIVKEYD